MAFTVIFDECAKRPTIREGTRGDTQVWLLKQDTGNWYNDRTVKNAEALAVL